MGPTRRASGTSKSPIQVSQTRSAFSSTRTMKRFPSSRCAPATKIVRSSASTADTQPQLHPALRRLSAMNSPVLHSYRKFGRTRLLSPMANQSKTPEAYVSDALDLMKKARWVKQYDQSAKGLRVDWTDRGKLAMDALGYVIEDLGPERLNQQLWWAVGTLAAVHMMP
jgi:hypothetical protein